jgi:exodeoxyribonuclease VII small subunit
VPAKATEMRAFVNMKGENIRCTFNRREFYFLSQREWQASGIGGSKLALFYTGTLCLTLGLPVSSKPKQRETEPNFEGAMDRLEKIVEQMESGKLPLEDLIVRYEEGMNLVKVCQERLANAEQKIEIIARNSAGKTVVKDFEPTPEPAAPAKAVDESESTNDEIKLF